MPYITNITITITDLSQKAEAGEAIEFIADLNLGSLVLVQIVVQVKTQMEFYHKLNSVANDCNFTNKDEIVKFLYLTLLRKCKEYGKECFHCHKKGHFSQLCHSRQHGKSPGPGLRNQTNNNRHSHCDVHEIDQSQFDDSVQFKQDSITIQFKTQVRQSNIMFDEISSTPSLQRVLTDVHIKATGQSNWLRCRFKIDSGACGNLMPLSMFKSLYNRLPSNTSVTSAICLLDYNKKEIKQLGTCNVSVRFRSVVKCVHFYVVPDKLKPIIGVGDALALGLTSFHCPIYNDWQSNSNLNTGKVISTFTFGMLAKPDLNIDSVNSNSSSANHAGKVNVNSTFTLGTLTKQIIINHLKYAHLFSGICHFKCKPVHITMKQNSTPVQKPSRRVPIAMRDKFKQELKSVEAQGIISKYDGHDISPEWLNSFIIVKKPNGSLCVCLDPTHLNKEIIRPVCNAQTMDDVVHELKDAKLFAVFDTSKGFFHVPLDAESKVLTAMLTPFGIYVYNVLAMGLSKATDLFETCI